VSTNSDPLQDALTRLGSASFSEAIRFHAPLGSLTTYRVGGGADALVEIATVAQAVELAEIVSDTGVATLVIGRGSNLLVADSGFRGVAVILGSVFAEIEVTNTRVVAGGAAKLPVVARTSVNSGLTGFEWAVGVPGSVGGAVRMNAGGHGSDMSDSLVSVRIVDLGAGEVRDLDAGSLQLGYRRSSVSESQIVMAAELELDPGSVDEGLHKLAEIVQWRRTNQPGGQNAGSVFANPPGHSAGRLIEEAGAKGLRVGSAHVSEKHANFIQADEGGSADDIVELMGRVAEMVSHTHGVDLQIETRLVGFADCSNGSD